MKPPVSTEMRQQVLNLRRSCSLREVAERTGLPVGTVKTICSRSGAFRDNEAHRALFSLPPLKVSSQTLPAVPELPPQRKVTGDKEVDAVLWLREVIGTGQAALIDKAMEGAKKIKTPLKDLEARYTKHLVSTNPGNPFATFASFDFADLEGLAQKSVKKAARQHEALSRFGDDLFAETPAEYFCIAALHGVEASRTGFVDDGVAGERFRKYPELLPQTLTDCLREHDYWRNLYSLRYAVDRYCSDQSPEAYAREQFSFRCLGEIRPRSKEESLQVMRWLLDDKQSSRRDDSGFDAILLNLIG